jgi:hypothetical protein
MACATPGLKKRRIPGEEDNKKFIFLAYYRNATERTIVAGGLVVSEIVFTVLFFF